MRLPGAMKETTGKDGMPKQRCIYTPHSLRATNATPRYSRHYTRDETTASSVPKVLKHRRKSMAGTNKRNDMT